MNVEQLRGQYDAVISLGSNCLPAIQIERNGLRQFTGVIDWMDSKNTRAIIQLIRNRFQGMLNLNHMVAMGPAGDFMLVIDKAYDIIVVHDFPLSINTETNWPSYYELVDKVNRRSVRLLGKMQTAERLLFIRMGCTAEEAVEMEQALREQVAHDFRLLIINHDFVLGLTDLNWPHANTASVMLPHANDIWKDNDALWSQLFQGISIKSP
ncbi:DUF1796 family putative cysteine peptidase [Paenibacillus sp. 481]|uniref:DUF1796 family putative cysteine peptidase n=1 Tax=Paenibacillus sp. 481 TaxID=2835869 RepID=UPI001E4F388D|nr:DUF1796 family putative cysteine peptidase [Paenibacillus sp. 481]UHA72285.1 peptidase [Paenibacillus sp. 481]